MMNLDILKDRISSLPKNAIDVILIRLPLRDAVRTSILSRGWRYEWSNISQLVFDKNHFSLCKSQSQADYDTELVKIVDQVLLLHRGPIRKFKLSIELKSCINMDRWILFVSRSGIREFVLDKWKGQIYKVPGCLFLCEEIIYLELCRCSLVPPVSFNGFNKLRNLDLQGVNFLNNGLENLISKCPLLSKLVLKNVTGCSNLRLRAPKLVDLSVDGAFKDLSLDKTPALVKASIRLSNGAICRLISLLGCLPSIKTLELLDQTLQILSAGDIPVCLPNTCQLSELSVSINFEDMQEMLAALCIFRSSPCLRKVDIKSISDRDLARIRVEDFWETHENFNCLLGQLQFVNVTEYMGTTSELKFVEFVLANAPVLETVQIQPKGTMADVIKIYRHLLRFKRVSPKAEIVIPE